MDILVTIAIASYNNAPYIERCIESVIGQSYKNLEILIVDDGSKDDTLTRLQKYLSDKRVCIIKKVNEGLSSVRQRGFEKAKGDYICFIDADDYIRPGYVSCMLKKIKEDNADICICSTHFEDMNGNCLQKESKTLSCVESEGPITVTVDNISDPNEYFTNQFFLSDSWNKMYRMAFLRKSGVMFNMPKGLNGTDTVFNRRLILRLPIYTMIAEDMYVHVIYKSSAVHRKGKDLQSTTMFITSQLLNDICTLGIQAKTEKRVVMFYYKGLLNALKDVYLESLDTCGATYQILKHDIKRHKCFIKEKKMPSLKISEVSSLELKSFLFTLRYAHCSLPLYFKLHKRIFK